jgi:hypothetical protein
MRLFASPLREARRTELKRNTEEMQPERTALVKMRFCFTGYSFHRPRNRQDTLRSELKDFAGQPFNRPLNKVMPGGRPRMSKFEGR